MNRQPSATLALAVTLALGASPPAFALANHTVADLAVVQIVATDLGSSVRYDVEYENLGDDTAYEVRMAFSNGVNPGPITASVLPATTATPTAPTCDLPQLVTPNNYLRTVQCTVPRIQPHESVWIRYVVPTASVQNVGAWVFGLTPDGDEDGSSQTENNYFEYLP